MIYFQSSLIVLVFFIFWFFICLHQKNYGLVDIAWGLGMMSIALFLLIKIEPNLQVSVSLLLIAVWGLRLGLYLGKRNWGKPEDYRYVNLRKRWGSQHPYIKAFLNVFVLQGVLLYVMMISSMNALTIQSTINPISMIVGLIIALFGLGFEVIGDYQLALFKGNPKNKGKLMTKGLWNLTRHPNYFGEVVFWWGVYITTFTGLGSLVGIVSPILITLLINYVSGIPLLEKKLKNREEYLVYAEKTPRMIPWIGTHKIK